MALSAEVLEAVALRILQETYREVYAEFNGTDEVNGAKVSMDPVTARAVARAVGQIVPYIQQHATVSVEVLTGPDATVPDAHFGKAAGSIQ